MQKKSQTIIGWDIGGAHVKAALIINGKVEQVQQLACPLWQGLNELETAVQTIIKQFALAILAPDCLHAITMTGELVDLFESRSEGVQKIAQTMQTQLVGQCLYYQCDQQFHPFVEAEILQERWLSVASANWHASAQLIAKMIPSGLLLDIGSTTTDIILLHGGQVNSEASDDAGRMRTGELVYTGVVRTPLMALGPGVRWQGADQAITAEYFATTADIYRLTTQLDPQSDMAGTADGGKKTEAATIRRLARMVGHDAQDLPNEDWLQLAEAFKAKQLSMVVIAAKRQLDRLIKLAPSIKKISVITAGVGAFLAEEVIAQMAQNGHYPTMHLQKSATLLNQTSQQMVANHSIPMRQWAGHCLPAVAVALLAHSHFHENNA